MTTFPLLKTRLAICLLFCLGMLSACTSAPKSASAVKSISFGEQPSNYKQIVKTYLDKKRSGATLDVEKIDFLNKPNKYIYQRFTQEEFGYRVCALVPNESMEDLRSHFFLIKNGKVIKHAYDSGMISLSKKFCNTVMLTSESRMNPAPAIAAKRVDGQGFKYISCQAKNTELFFAFNPEKKQLLQQNDGKQVAEFDIETLSETFIIATSTDSKVSINRVSGTMLYQTKGTESQAHCELSSQQRF